jgi:hypothetical protein
MILIGPKQKFVIRRRKNVSVVVNKRQKKEKGGDRKH